MQKVELVSEKSDVIGLKRHLKIEAKKTALYAVCYERKHT